MCQNLIHSISISATSNINIFLLVIDNTLLMYLMCHSLSFGLALALIIRSACWRLMMLCTASCLCFNKSRRCCMWKLTTGLLSSQHHLDVGSSLALPCVGHLLLFLWADPWMQRINECIKIEHAHFWFHESIAYLSLWNLRVGSNQPLLAIWSWWG